MLSFIIKRMGHSVISISLVVVAVFFIARMTGSPAELYLPIDTPDSVIHDYAVLHGLDKPLWVQFVNFIVDLCHFEFGQSLRLNVPASEAIFEALPTTVMLALIVIPLALILAIVIGIGTALRPNSWFDRFASSLSLSTSSIPEFWIALVAILVFAVSLKILPSSGYGSFIYWVLPVGVLTVRPLGNFVQVIRNSLLATLSSQYVKAARAKGAGSIRIIFVHCLRNSMIPVVTMASDAALNILNGVVIIEIMFGFPGLGRLMLDSVLYRDYALLQAIVIVTAIIVFVVNTITDFIYVLIDPRVRYG